MQRRVIGMRVADETDFRAGLRFVRIKPKTQFGQQDAAAMKPDA